MEKISVILCYVLMGKVLPLLMRTFGWRWNAEGKLKWSHLICLNQQAVTVNTVQRKITRSCPPHGLHYWQWYLCSIIFTLRDSESIYVKAHHHRVPLLPSCIISQYSLAFFLSKVSIFSFCCDGLARYNNTIPATHRFVLLWQLICVSLASLSLGCCFRKKPVPAAASTPGSVRRLPCCSGSNTKFLEEDFSFLHSTITSLALGWYFFSISLSISYDQC